MFTHVAINQAQLVVGMVIYRVRPRHLRILQLGVHPDWRRQGVATQLWQRVLSKLHPERRSRLVVVVPEQCVDVQLFLRQQKVRALELLCNRDTGQDDIYFEYRV